MMDANFWNTRFANPNYAYGQEANLFLQEQLRNFPRGKFLFPCDGEGRNGVYAATLGHTVSAFDMSAEGKRKALQLAETKGVQIDYTVVSFLEADYPDNSFDGIVLIYAQFPEAVRIEAHQRVARWLKPGGTLIIEGFSVAHQAFQRENPHAGGPKDASMLYTNELLAHDFAELNISYLATCLIELHEGAFHDGKASVVRLVATKK